MASVYKCRAPLADDRPNIDGTLEANKKNAWLAADSFFRRSPMLPIPFPT